MIRATIRRRLLCSLHHGVLPSSDNAIVLSFSRSNHNSTGVVQMLLADNVKTSSVVIPSIINTSSFIKTKRTFSSSTKSSVVAKNNTQNFSSLAFQEFEDYDDDYNYDESSSLSSTKNGGGGKEKHCTTCTCEEHDSHSVNSTTTTTLNKPITLTVDSSNMLAPCGELRNEYNIKPMPPPLPEPKYSVRRRLLSTETIALNSREGKKRLLESLSGNTAASYLALTQHFTNQSEPAYCGVTTALVVLNAFEYDTAFRWKGGWRYWADESVLLAQCSCLNDLRIQRSGITALEFQRLVSCQGIDSTFKRPTGAEECKHEYTGYTLTQFRKDVQHLLTEREDENMGILVVSFGRTALGQTGDGHFSPIAAYHATTDSVLVLDVARYKYPPYWVRIDDMYESMKLLDTETGLPRGWYLMYNKNQKQHDITKNSEIRRPAQSVPVAGRDPHPCPVHPVQVQFCKNNKQTTKNKDINGTKKGINRE